MMDHTELRGLMVALTTPFKADRSQSVDLEALQSNVAMLAPSPAKVFVVGGTMAEPFSLSWAELVDTAIVTRETLGPSGLVILGTEPAPETWGPSCRLVLDGTVDALMVKPSSSDVAQVVEELSSLNSHGVPFVLYENPTLGASFGSTQLVESLLDLESVIGYKYAGADIEWFASVVSAIGSEIAVIAGAEDPLLAALMAGPSGCMPASAAFAPGFIQEIMDATTERDFDAARALNRRLMDYRRLLRPRTDRGELAFIPYTKAAMDFAGMKGGSPRPPLTALEAGELAELRDVLARNELL